MHASIDDYFALTVFVAEHSTMVHWAYKSHLSSSGSLLLQGSSICLVISRKERGGGNADFPLIKTCSALLDTS